MIRLLTIEDYEEIYRLWQNTPGVGLRSLDDSKEGIRRFLLRNPYTCFVSMEEGRIAGVILSGHDGRRGYIYHACVDGAFRRRTIGRQLALKVMAAMNAEGIHKLALVAFRENDLANYFWSKTGWELREDLNFYSISLNNDNN
ncbi:MAG TPA: GNAT family N-acetyltransferase [Mobilitalea sp.]|nr:GNAT family N-acetyltransferase [Mobilitalea sp.]